MSSSSVESTTGLPAPDAPAPADALSSGNAYLTLRHLFPAPATDIVLTVQDTQGGEWNYTADDLERASARLAHLLSGLDLKSPSRLLLMLPPSPEALMLLLGALRAGVAVQPLPMDLSEEALSQIISRDQPEILVCEARRFTPLSRWSFRLGVRHVFTLTPDREGTLLARAAPQSEAPWTASVTERAVAMWLDAEKGVPRALSHAQLNDIVQVLHRYANWPHVTSHIATTPS